MSETRGESIRRGKLAKEIGLRRADDGDPFNAGWNAALDDAEKKVKELTVEGLAPDGVRALIAKSAVLALLRDR